MAAQEGLSGLGAPRLHHGHCEQTCSVGDALPVFAFFLEWWGRDRGSPPRNAGESPAHLPGSWLQGSSSQRGWPRRCPWGWVRAGVPRAEFWLTWEAVPVVTQLPGAAPSSSGGACMCHLFQMILDALQGEGLLAEEGRNSHRAAANVLSLQPLSVPTCLSQITQRAVPKQLFPPNFAPNN